MPLCADHAYHVDDEYDLCPIHAAQYRPVRRFDAKARKLKVVK
jgi:hypothetical protein